jgi:DMSO/TMAO reductase YedYZ molybdopterin-dependent catalytic subunit
VTTLSKFDCSWRRVSIREVIDRVRPRIEACFGFYTSYDGCTTNTRMLDLPGKDVLVATELDGKPLTLDHGGPARVIIPKLYVWSGSKFAKKIEFREEDGLGFWAKRGYRNTAYPWSGDRICGEKAD